MLCGSVLILDAGYSAKKKEIWCDPNHGDVTNLNREDVDDVDHADVGERGEDCVPAQTAQPQEEDPRHRTPGTTEP